MKQKGTAGIRYLLPDMIRGVTLVSMIAFHTCWDLVYLAGKEWDWYRSVPSYVWQQSICWSFILLSGFCWLLGRRHLKRGLIVFGCGLLVSAVTPFVSRDSVILFGILTFFGSAMLLMIPLEKWLRHVPAAAGLPAALLVFLFLKNINRRYLGLQSWKLFVPSSLYRGYPMAYLGFPFKGFYSADYFSLLPWIFLYISGYFLFRLLKDSGALERLESASAGTWLTAAGSPFAFLGKHSLLIYLLHQPVVYAVLLAIGLL